MRGGNDDVMIRYTEMITVQNMRMTGRPRVARRLAVSLRRLPTPWMSESRMYGSTVICVNLM